VVEGSRIAFSTMRWLPGGEAVLGLADEFRLADEDRQHAGSRDHHVVAGDDAAARLLPVSSA
jgi:hypothetical protein